MEHPKTKTHKNIKNIGKTLINLCSRKLIFISIDIAITHFFTLVFFFEVEIFSKILFSIDLVN